MGISKKVVPVPTAGLREGVFRGENLVVFRVVGILYAHVVARLVGRVGLFRVLLDDHVRQQTEVRLLESIHKTVCT